MATRWNQRNVSLKIEEMTKEATPVFPGDMNLDRTGKGRDEIRDLNVQGVTFFAEDFKTAAETSPSDTPSSIMASDTDVINGNVYYVSVIQTTEYEGTYVNLYSYFTDPASLQSVKPNRTSMVVTCNKTSGSYSTRVYCNSYAPEVTFKQKQVIDLTKMGELPNALKIKFSKFYWSDLTASECDEVIPYYVPNATYDDSLVLENRGSNIINESDAMFRGWWSGTGAADYENGKYIIDDVGNGIPTVAFLVVMKQGVDYTVHLKDFYAFQATNDIAVMLLDSDENTLNNINENRLDSEGEVTITGNERAAYLVIHSSGISWSSSAYCEFTGVCVSEGTCGKSRSDKLILPELNGLGGTYDDLNYKRVERETVTVATNSGTASKSGTGSCVLISSTGDVVWGTISGTTISATTADGDYTAIYKLSTAETQSSHVDLMSKYLECGHNNFIGTGYKLDEFDGDGSTTAFSLTTTADSSTYDVYVAGIKKTSGVTKTTAGFTFDSAPKNGAIIEAKYNTTTNNCWVATLNTYEPSGTEVTITAPTEISLQENAEYHESVDRFGNKTRKLKSKDYSVSLDISLLEDTQAFYDAWKDKKFRIIIENTNGSSYEKDILALCSIEGYSKNYLGQIQSLNIRATDLYEGVTT